MQKYLKYFKTRLQVLKTRKINIPGRPKEVISNPRTFQNRIETKKKQINLTLVRTYFNIIKCL